MIVQVKFKRSGHANLRNGYTKCLGLDISNTGSDDTVMFSSITSKGNLANGHISIPKEHLPEVIEELKKLI